MSEQPNSPPPGGSNRGTGEPTNFNWRPLVLFGVAILILAIAILHPPGGSAKSLTYAQFRKVWDQGRVITEDDKRPLKILTDESAYDATITGWLEPPTKAPGPGTPMKRVVFQVPVDKMMQGAEVQAILGEHARVIKADDQPAKVNIRSCRRSPDSRRAPQGARPRASCGRRQGGAAATCGHGARFHRCRDLRCDREAGKPPRRHD